MKVQNNCYNNCMSFSRLRKMRHLPLFVWGVFSSSGFEMASSEVWLLTRTQSDTLAHTCALMQTLTYTPAHVNTHYHKQEHTPTHTITHQHRLMQTNTHKHTLAHTLTHNNSTLTCCSYFIVMPHWETRPPLPGPDIPYGHIISTLS